MKKIILLSIVFIVFSASLHAQSPLKKWIGTGIGVVGTDFNNALNWLPIGVPTSADSVSIAFTNDGLIKLSAPVTIGHFTMTLAGDKNIAIFNIGNFNMKITGTTKVDITAGNHKTQLLFGTDESSTGTLEFVGDAVFGLSNPAGNNYHGMAVIPTGNSGSSFIFRSNFTQGLRTATGTGLEPGNLIFDGAGIQTFTANNMFVTSFINVFIGRTGSINNPTVNLVGATYPSILGNLTINRSSTLNLGTVPWNRATPPGGTLLIPSNGTLKVGGSANGILNSNFPANFSTYSLDSTSTVEFNGAAQTIPGATQLVTSYGNLTTSGTLTKSLGSNIEVKRQLLLGAATTFALGNYNTTLISNDKTTAYVAPITTATISYGSGRFIVERYLFAKKAWRFLATPVTTESSPTVTASWMENGAATAGFGTQITGPGGTGAGFDQYTQRVSFKTYNMAANTWNENLTPASTIANSQGYMVFVRGDRTVAVNGTTGATTLRMKGKINTGTQVFTVNANRFESIGNPYASRIAFLSAVKNNLADGFYTWNPQSPGSYTVGAYEYYTRSGSNYATSGGKIKNFIESGEAIFVQNNDLTNPGSLTIAESDKTSGSSMLSFTGGGLNAEARLTLNMFAKNPDSSIFLADGVMLNFNENYSAGIDNDDAKKIMNISDNLAIPNGSANLIVESRPPLHANDTIFLNLTGTRVSAYRFRAEPENFTSAALDAYLADKFLAIETPLSLTAPTDISFDITADIASKAADRFKIVFKQHIFPVALTDINAVRNFDKSVTVKWKVENEINVTTLEIERSEDKVNFTKVGNALPQNNNSVASYAYTDAKASLNANYYRIKSTEAGGNVKYSSIAKVEAVTDIKAAFSIFPNPVTEGKLNVAFTNQYSGIYIITVSDSKGQKLHAEKINVTDIHSVKVISLRSSTAAGSYVVSVTDPAGNQSTVPFIIR